MNTAFISPLFLVLLWFKPVSHNYLTEREFYGRGTLMSAHSFEITRIILILVVCGLRVAATPKYLQAYLNLAPQRLAKLKKEAGKIKSDDLKRMVVGVFYYLCVVSLQYLGPIVLIMATSLLWKVLGDYSWLSYVSAPMSSVPMSTAGSDFTLAGLREVFTPIAFRGVLGFMTWWQITVWFTSTLIGFSYHSYFST